MPVLIMIDAPDVDRAEQFYAAGLGLERVRRIFDGTVAEMRLDGQMFNILPQEQGKAPFEGGPGRGYGRHWTPVHLDFVVDDLKAAVERATAAGAKVEQPVAEHDWGLIAMLADPFGHGFCLLQFTRGYR